MSDSIAGLRRKIESAGDLQAVVRTMKAMAASSIGQYETSVRALSDYYQAVELGLGACFRKSEPVGPMATFKPHYEAGPTRAIIFGSDQGLVGRFNDAVVEYAIKSLEGAPDGIEVWAVGERAQTRLVDEGLPLLGWFAVPNSLQAITLLVGRIATEIETHRDQKENSALWVFYNRPKGGAFYESTGQRLLPLDEEWRQGLTRDPWPTANLPEVMGSDNTTMRALLREYLFISLFRACAESLASENASRLAAMQRADKNISDLLEQLNGDYHQLRQSSIDEELFDVVSGFEALVRI